MKGYCNSKNYSKDNVFDKFDLKEYLQKPIYIPPINKDDFLYSTDLSKKKTLRNLNNSNSNKTVKNVNKTKGFDTIEISSLGRSLIDYSYDNNIDSAKKVAEIKSKVDSGTYNIDARLTARSILNSMKESN